MIYSSSTPLTDQTTIEILDSSSNGNQNSIGMFLYAIEASETRRQYMSKLKTFFDFIELKGTLEEQSIQFVQKANNNSSSNGTNNNWTLVSIMHFINYQKERVTKREITDATLRNYYKPIQRFCEMNDISIGWKKVAKDIPHLLTRLMIGLLLSKR